MAPDTEKKEPGFFSKLFSSSEAIPPLKYRVLVRSTTSQSVVSVLDASGNPDTSANAARIIKVLVDDLK